jgi:hypothetical protein
MRTAFDFVKLEDDDAILPVIIERNIWGGTWTARAREEFCALYLQCDNLVRAIKLAEHIINWPDTYSKEDGQIIVRRPGFTVMRDWALMADDGKVEPSEKTHQNIRRRLERYVAWHPKDAMMANAEAAVELAKQAKEGTLPAEKSSQLLHVNNGVGFMYREILNAARANQSANGGPAMHVGKLIISPPNATRLRRAHHETRKVLPGDKPRQLDIIDVEAKDVTPVG